MRWCPATGFIAGARALAILLMLVPASAMAQCELTRLEASNGIDGDHYGAVAIDGRNVAVGAQWTDVAAGSVYLYRLNWEPAEGGPGEMTWQERAILEADDRAPGDNFGELVSISGNRVLVAAKGDDDSGSLSGSAYVFSQNSGRWVQEAKLTAPDGSRDDLFSEGIAIDGDWIVVGARGHQDSRGAAYVYQYNQTDWDFLQKLQPSDLVDIHIFGAAVAISGDRIAVGALGDDTHGVNTGAVYIFHWNGTEWEEEAKLTAPQTDIADNLGESLDFGINDRLLVAGTEGGAAAYVFRRTESGWRTVPVAQLVASDGDAFDEFGAAVAATNNTILVGAPFEGPAADGAVYVYTRDGNSWTETSKFKAGDAIQFDDYGRTVGISGRLGLVGAPLHPFEFGPGHAYVLSLHESFCP